MVRTRETAEDEQLGDRLPQPSQPGVLPMRPLTLGELLDAAVTLLRTRAPLLVGLGFAAAALEQAVLLPLRRLADVDLYYQPADDRWPAFALLLAVGFGAEAFLVAALAGPASASAPAALLGRRTARPAAIPAPRVGAGVGVVAVVAGGLCGAAVLTVLAWPATFLLLAPVTLAAWAWLYGSLGLAVPAVVIERRPPGAALLRSVTLASRQVTRGVRVRLGAYLGWFTVRLAWGMGVLALVQLIHVPQTTLGDNLLMAVVFLLVNAVAYPSLACLDAVLYLEARMRTEGLDIALRHARHRGLDPTPALRGV